MTAATLDGPPSLYLPSLRRVIGATNRPALAITRAMNATPRLPRQGGAMDLPQFIDFVRQRGLAVIATRGADGAPQAALVGIAATGRAELVFDTSRSSRKYRNLSAFAQVAMVIGWDKEMTVQCEGIAHIPMGSDHDRCLDAYLAQYPDGVERAHHPDIVHVPRPPKLAAVQRLPD
jgi:hypothetical protein